MKDETFRVIVETVILPIGNTLIDRDSKLSWRKGWEQRLLDNYQTTRQCIHNDMEKESRVFTHLIDRHKIAAAFTMAIMNCKPMENSGGILKPSSLARLANEALAFLTAVKIIQDFLVKRFKNDPDMANKLANSAIIFPPANDHLYPVHAYKALFNAGHAGLNSFILANLYFLVESYQLQSLGWNDCLPEIPAQPSP